MTSEQYTRLTEQCPMKWSAEPCLEKNKQIFCKFNTSYPLSSTAVDSWGFMKPKCYHTVSFTRIYVNDVTFTMQATRVKAESLLAFAAKAAW